MSMNAVSTTRFLAALTSEADRQKTIARLSSTKSMYRYYAVGNALAKWNREHSGAALSDFAAKDSLTSFKQWLDGMRHYNLSEGSYAGYAIVSRLLANAIR